MIFEPEQPRLVAQKNRQEGDKLRVKVLKFVLSAALIAGGLFKLYLFKMLICSTSYQTAMSFLYLPLLGVLLVILGVVTLIATLKHPSPTRIT